MPHQDRTVPTNVLLTCAMWLKAVLLCIAIGIVALIWGKHIWARAVVFTLLAIEFITVAVAALMTARLLLRRQARRIEDRIELGEDVRKLREIR